MNLVRIAVVEDDRILRESLAALLSAIDDFELIGAVGSLREGKRLAAQQPDVLLLDLQLPDGRVSSNFWCGPKGNGTLQCRILSQPLATLVGITDVESLFKFDLYQCGQRAGGQLFCTLFDGTSWVEQASPYPTPPAGTDWVTYQFGNGLSCGLKSSGQRFCAGSRRLGSLGDGFDERLPGFVSLPQ